MTVRDEDIALTTQKNDQQAFASLITRQYNSLLFLRFQLTGRQNVARELTPNSSVILPARLSNYKRRSKVTTWFSMSPLKPPHFKFCIKHSLAIDPKATPDMRPIISVSSVRWNAN